MPTLDWLHRDAAFRIADTVPTRVLRPHAAGHVFGEVAARDNLLIQGDNRDVAADIQYAPEVGMDVERDYGIAARKKLESFGWRFDAQLGSKRTVE